MLASPGDAVPAACSQTLGNEIGDHHAAPHPSARQLAVIVLFSEENTGSPPRTNYIKNVVLNVLFFFSPLVLFSDYVEPAEKVFISVCKLYPPGVFLPLCPRLCWMQCWSWEPRQTWEERTRGGIRLQNKALFCHFVPLKSPTP